jgi:hypothetical protein
MKPLLFLLLLLSCVYARAQGPDYKHWKNYSDSIRLFDLSSLWRADSIPLEDDGTKAPFPEPIGYIGENFQRFDIHFLSVDKSTHDPRVYLVTGKTRVKGNVCSFSGTMTIVSAELYRGSWDRHYREGSVTCAVWFNEDSVQKGSGVITGRMETDFCLDRRNRFLYDALDAEADSYSNNQCVGLWRGYRSRITRKCNWGDYRIPESRGLDDGAGVFAPDDKFKRFGWENWENDTTAWWQ